MTIRKYLFLGMMSVVTMFLFFCTRDPSRVEQTPGDGEEPAANRWEKTDGLSLIHI